MTHNNPPLTAAKRAFLEKVCVFADEAVAETLQPIIAPALKAHGLPEDTTLFEFKIDEKDAWQFYEAADEYAEIFAAQQVAQQTAAKDARIAELEAERDALQSKLDDALAQVAMLVDTLDYVFNAPIDSIEHGGVMTTVELAIHETQSEAESYKAELLKPWRELREVVDALWKSENWTEDKLNRVGEALKATEELTDD